MPIKTYLTSKEIQQMIDQAPNLRDKVILSFLADVGCRVSELLHLRLADLDLEGSTALIPHLKRGIKKKCPSCGRTAGRNTRFCSKCGADLSGVAAEGIDERSRMINIGPTTVDLLQEYAKDLKPEERIINITRQAVYNIVRRAGVRIGLDDKAIRNTESGKNHYIHPHSFRDALAVSWLGFAGTDVGKQKALQEHLGHASFETTMRYFKLQPAKIKQVSDEVRKLRFATQAHSAEDEVPAKDD